MIQNDWPDLSDTAMQALRDIALMMPDLPDTAIWSLRVLASIYAGKYTGPIEVSCCQGGVSMIRREEVMKPPK